MNTRIPSFPCQPARRLRPALFVLLGLGVAALPGCATRGPSNVHVDTGAIAVNCERMAWRVDHDGAASFAEQRMGDAVVGVLAAKGYEIDAQAPDCVVMPRLALRETQARSSGPSFGLGVGGGSRRVGGGLGVSMPLGSRPAAADGTLTLDVFDVARSAQIWSGTAETGLSTPQPTQEEIDRAVQRILWQFPDRGQAGTAPGGN